MREQFRVDLRGIVDILSHHLYSSPRVYLREVLQNATDALTARAELEPGFAGEVRVTSAVGHEPMVVRDNGVGLTDEEMRKVLATIGGSSKRGDFAVARGKFLGQFGIGLLSCFLVADEIRLRSRSAKDAGGETILWVGHADGTFDIGIAEEPLDAPGTEVVIRPRHGDLQWCNPVTARELATDFAEQLSVPVYVDGDLVSQVTPPWELPVDEQLAWCRSRLGFDAMGIISLESSLLNVKGVGFVLPFSSAPGQRAGDRLYSRGMLVSDQGSQILPGWAFFCRAVLDSGELPLTASREALQETASLDVVRERLGARLLSELIMVQGMAPDVYDDIVRLHADGLKALAVTSDDMRSLLRATMPFTSNQGTVTLEALVTNHQRVNFVTDPDVYAALSDVAVHAGELVVDASGPHDPDLLRAVDPQERVFHQIEGRDVVLLARPLPAEDLEAAERLVAEAERALDNSMEIQVAAFEPATRPTLWWPHEPGTHVEGYDSTLILNARHETVHRLMEAAGQEPIDDALRAMHVVGLLLGRASVSVDQAVMLAASVAGLVRDGARSSVDA